MFQFARRIQRPAVPIETPVRFALFRTVDTTDPAHNATKPPVDATFDSPDAEDTDEDDPDLDTEESDRFAGRSLLGARLRRKRDQAAATMHAEDSAKLRAELDEHATHIPQDPPERPVFPTVYP